MVRRTTYQPDWRIDLGDAWAGNSVNCAIYRAEPGAFAGPASLAVAYYDDTGSALVREILWPAGAADPRLGRLVGLPHVRPPTDGHDVMSMGCDSTGRLHVVYGAHASGPGCVSIDPDTWSASSQKLDPETADEVTYPHFVNDAQTRELLLIFRRGRHDAGAIYVQRWDATRCTWTADAVALLSGLSEPWTAGPYLNTPMVERNGQMGLFCVWRLPKRATTGGAVVNAGLDYVRSTDAFRTLSTIDGIGLSLPVTPTNAPRVVAVPLAANLINQGSAALLPGGRPIAATYWNDEEGRPQYHLAWFDGRTWRVSQVSAFRSRFRLDGGGTLSLPHSRPRIVADEAGRVGLLFRSDEVDGRLILRVLTPPLYDLNSAFDYVLADRKLGRYEPTLIQEAWTKGQQIVLYLQACQQTGEAMPFERHTEGAELSAWQLPQPRTWWGWLKPNQRAGTPRV
ncbi:MAG: BNR-4 repeat-containing protein [Alsobacter sp.]